METVNERESVAPGPRGAIGPRVRRLVLGSAAEAAWTRPAFFAVLALTAVLYIWGLDRNGYANNYYSAAVVAGTKSWKALFFGAFDAGSFITIDKPPAALWLMEISTRIFGISSWSILLPEALLGVGTVALLMDAVRRAFGPVAAVIAGVVTALTPIAVLMFRYNNPDALLTFLMVGAAWALVRSLETGRTRWLLLSAVAVGFAFNTKYLQGYIVLPALVLTYLLFARPRLRQRLLQLLGAGAALIVSTGWWMLIVSAIPASARPFIGGSTTNSVLDLVLGYDGLGRIFGQGLRGNLGLGSLLEAIGGGSSTAGAAAGPGGAGFGGQPGLLRLFDTQVAGEISWLLPFAAVALLVGLWAHRSSPRIDLARASYVLWGLWLLTHAVVFSFASGIFHPYYTVAMAPAVGALVGAGVVQIWRIRRQRPLLAGVVAAAALLPTAWWGHQLLARTPSFAPGLGNLELGLAVLASVLLLIPRRLALPTRLARAALVAGAAAVLLGPAAFAVDNLGKSVSGPIPSSGPAPTLAGDGARGVGGGPTYRLGPQPGRFQGQAPPGGFAGAPPRGFAGGPPPGLAGAGNGTARGAGPGGDRADSTLVSYLLKHQGSATWLVAVPSANQGAPIEIATGKAVLAMGGFSGRDPAMTVSKLQELVSSGQLRYVLIGGPGGAEGGGTQEGAGSVSTWVTQHCKPVDYAGTGSSSSTLYDCSTAVTGSGS